MRIGILTFQFADNYGALLQAYSLRTYLKKARVEQVEIINYANEKLKNDYSLNPLKKAGMRQKLVALYKLPKMAFNRMKFQQFRSELLDIDINKWVCGVDDKKYDIVIVGSDQVWNMQITHNDLLYFLPNSNLEYKKCSYAASANNEFVGKEYAEQVKKYLEDFKSVSVREKQLSELIVSKYGIPNQVVLDPVFLTKSEDWEKIEVKPKGISDKFVVYYSLQANDDLEKMANRLGESMQLPVYVVHPLQRRIAKCGKLLTGVGPREFLYLINHAQAVVANSFHAFTFSLLFGKDIYFTYVEGLSNRVSSLVNLLSLSVNQAELDKVNYIRFSKANTVALNAHIRKSEEYLRSIIHEK